MTEAAASLLKVLQSGLFDFWVLPNLVGKSERPIMGAGEYPAWVHSASDRISRAIFSHAHEALESDYSRAYCLGLAVGMVHVSDKKFGELVVNPLLDEIAREVIVSPEQAQAFAQMLYGDEKATVPENSLISLELEEDIATTEAKLNSGEMEDFHKGALAAARMLNGRNKANDATDIYIFMVICWRWVETMTSVDELHDALTLFLGRNRIGADVDRTRQICKRVKKRFRAPGRPRKSRSGGGVT